MRNIQRERPCVCGRDMRFDTMGHCCIFKKITPNPPMLSGVMIHTICQFILYFYDIYIQVCTQKLRCEENNGV